MWKKIKCVRTGFSNLVKSQIALFDCWKYIFVINGNGI